MADLLIQAEQNATLLMPEELLGLLPTHIVNRGQLNAAEQANILNAERWAFSSRMRRNVLTEDFVRLLHRRMFGGVWRWAGGFRRTEKNIGVDYWRIAVELNNLVQDARTWSLSKVYPPDEIAVRFKHRLVAIHCFSNGNGRHSRMIGDLVAVREGQSRFTWGRIEYASAAEARIAYMNALGDADRNHNYAPLLAFARA